MKQVIDNFSTGSSDYVTFRPESPKEIFDFLYANVKTFDTAWDCGTGNGQVAAVLAEKFRQVYGTDISDAQLKLAPRKDNITYLTERAEQTTLPEHSIDLVTIAQAIHWFDFDKFYTEVKRVTKPGALVCAWTYSTLRLTPAIDEVIDRLYEDITGPYWDNERRYVDEEYRTIPFPFKELDAPPVTILKRQTMQQVLGYLRTWSGLKHYMNKEGTDPTLLIAHDLEKAWGNNATLEVRWPVYIRAGIVE